VRIRAMASAACPWLSSQAARRRAHATVPPAMSPPTCPSPGLWKGGMRTERHRRRRGSRDESRRCEVEVQGDGTVHARGRPVPAQPPAFPPARGNP
jgi:hypothetical protein